MSTKVNKVTAAGLLVALGIIYGDIGTSPLYVFNAIINSKEISELLVVGGLSCIIWTLTLQTTLKYVVLTLKADNKGEGGIFSLYTLVRRQKKWLVIPAMIGGAFSYKLDDNTSWKIINSETFSVLNSGTGSIEKMTFSTPGNFEIEISEVISTSANDCKHGHFPHKIMIEVSPIKMIFDFATIKFSNEIIGGQSQSSNEISVDVYIESFNNEKVVFNDGKVISAPGSDFS